MFGVNIKIIVAIAISVLLAYFGYWIKWSFDMVEENTEQRTTIGKHERTIKGLREDILDYTKTQEKLDNGFTLIEEDQIDLICTSRASADVMVPVGKPTIVEVIKYRDRQTGCTTVDKTKAEEHDPVTTVLRPTNETISLQVINNTWKAYCLATANKEESCQPFR
ncbi:hypothetical protein D3C85_15810 [compost metagenome]